MTNSHSLVRLDFIATQSVLWCALSTTQSWEISLTSTMKQCNYCQSFHTKTSKNTKITELQTHGS